MNRLTRISRTRWIWTPQRAIEEAERIAWRNRQVQNAANTCREEMGLSGVCPCCGQRDDRLYLAALLVDVMARTGHRLPTPLSE